MSTYSATVNNSGNGTTCTYTFTLSGSDATITAFAPTGVADLVIPSSVTDDGNSDNSGNVVAIGDGSVFGSKGLTGSVTIPNTLIDIGSYGFYNNSGLTSIIFQSISKLETLGLWVFYDCGFTTVVLPESLISIGSKVWNGNLTEITIFDSVTGVDYQAFLDSGLTTVYMKTTNGLGLTVPSVGTVSFYGATDVSILLDETIYTVVAVADYTLSGASNITVIALDDSVTSVGDNTFSEMTSLTTIQVNADHPEWGSDIGTTIDIGGALGVSVEQHLVCFDESTLILCPSGYVPVTNLKIGDSVVTYKHGNRKISRIRVTKLVLNEEVPQNVNPYKKQGYAKHMFRMKKTGDMTDDLLVTGRHGILLDDLSSCSYFVDKVFDTKIDDKILLDVGLCSRFERETECKEYTIYQIELGCDLPRYGIYANGVLMESLLSVYE